MYLIRPDVPQIVPNFWGNISGTLSKERLSNTGWDFIPFHDGSHIGLWLKIWTRLAYQHFYMHIVPRKLHGW